LDDIVKKLPKNPKDYNVAFITTAAEGEGLDPSWIQEKVGDYKKRGFIVDDFSITKMSKEEIENKLKDKNIIHCCGGNTFYLMDQLVKTGAGEIIKNKIKEGVIYTGSSAGAMVAGNHIELVAEIDDQQKAPDLKTFGLEIIDLAILPHWGSQELINEYKKLFDAMYVENIKIQPLSNYQYLWVQDDNIQLIQITQPSLTASDTSC